MVKPSLAIQYGKNAGIIWGGEEVMEDVCCGRVLYVKGKSRCGNLTSEICVHVILTLETERSEGVLGD